MPDVIHHTHPKETGPNLYLEPFDDHCFAWKRPCFEGLTLKNRGNLVSRYMILYEPPANKPCKEVNFKNCGRRLTASLWLSLCTWIWAVFVGGKPVSLSLRLRGLDTKSPWRRLNSGGIEKTNASSHHVFIFIGVLGRTPNICSIFCRTYFTSSDPHHDISKQPC